MARYELTNLGDDFVVLILDLIAEMTGAEIATAGPAPNRSARLKQLEGVIRWPETLGGELWSGTMLLATPRIHGTDHLSVLDQVVTATRQVILPPPSFPPNPFDYLPPGFGEPTPAEVAAPRFDLPAAGNDPQPIKPPAPPDYLVVAFAAPAEAEDQGPDISAEVSAIAAAAGVRGVKVWNPNTIGQLLDLAPRARRRYFARLAPADVLSTIHTYDIGISDNFREAVRLQAFERLRSDQWVRLTQAGDESNTRLKLNQIGIDLPIDGNRRAARSIVQAGDAYAVGSAENANLLLLGGPGQGKSTITQLIAQCYRVALLSGDPRLSREIHGIVDASRRGFAQAGIPIPAYRRWPVRIELAGYVDQAVRTPGASLMKYLLAGLDEHAGQPLTMTSLRAWLHAWPMLLILDGFDEVASAAGRETLMEHLAAFTDRIGEIGCDVFIVATTRPQGYAGEFAGRGYTNVELTPLNRAEAVQYGRQLAEVRHHADPMMLQQVTQGLNAAASEPLTERLMSSPLQVTIMSILLEAHERVPRGRYALFEAYYRTIYKREENKKGTVAAAIENWHPQIDALHNWLGLVLQVNSEIAGDLDAAASQADLRLRIVRQLRDEGYPPPEAAGHAATILEAVVNRLVLIVPKRIEEVGFEIRSIQEFFAARAIVSERDEEVCRRLGRIVEPAHWRNTWLFAAGKAFSERRYLRDRIVDVLTEIDTHDPVRTVVAPGADLALDLLEDDVAGRSPGIQRRMYKHVLELLRYPPDLDLQRRAGVLIRLAEQDDEARFLLRQGIDQALLGPPGQVAAAREVLGWANRGASRLLMDLRPKLFAAERILARTGAPDAGAQTIAHLLHVAAQRDGLDAADRKLVMRLASSFESAAAASEPVHGDQSTVRTVLEECMGLPQLRELLAEVTLQASGHGAATGTAMRDVLRAWLQRAVVGEGLLEMTYPPDGHELDGDHAGP